MEGGRWMWFPAPSERATHCGMPPLQQLPMRRIQTLLSARPATHCERTVIPSSASTDSRWMRHGGCQERPASCRRASLDRTLITKRSATMNTETSAALLQRQPLHPLGQTHTRRPHVVGLVDRLQPPHRLHIGGLEDVVVEGVGEQEGGGDSAADPEQSSGVFLSEEEEEEGANRTQRGEGEWTNPPPDTR